MTSIDTRKDMSRGTDKVSDEVEHLLKVRDGRLTNDDIRMLRQKHNDDTKVVNAILDGYYEKVSKIRKMAGAFTQAIKEKYALRDLSFNRVLEKALKYKEKYGLTNAEFSEFQRLYQKNLAGHEDESKGLVVPNAIGKLLGPVGMEQYINGLKVDGDERVLQELLRLHEETRILHAQVVTQSVTYEDCNNTSVAALGSWNQALGQNPQTYVHPVVAALFLPKIPILDMKFLHASIVNLVKRTYKKEAIESLPDYELKYDLSTDNNDVVCDTRSTLGDLLHRANLQRHLWNSVLQLRNGQFFFNAALELLMAVENCKINKYENSDLLYHKTDATILRRLFAAFSFRPTVVTTLPSVPIGTPTYSYSIPSLVNQISMINLRLPQWMPTSTTSGSLDLKSALNQTQLVVENGLLVLRHINVIFSRGVLVFTVDRRQRVVQLTQAFPYFMTSAPKSMLELGYDRIDTSEIQFDHQMPLTYGKGTSNTRTLYLRSVVIAKILDPATKVPPTTSHSTVGSTQFIVGSETIVLCNNSSISPTYFKYQPQEVYQHKPVGGTSTSGIMGIGPLGPLGPTTSTSIQSPIITITSTADAVKQIKEQSLIFVYQDDKEDSGVVKGTI